ncbi:MAG: nitrile hydratase subunit beta [Rhodopseudomonas sp.]|uniref:nitrile hydratase subunit beta n=1 Tax=Rhodopseudomonas sp. TaxID=1078 RepID=UPI0017E70DA8|nr:nitrile hydratase subunit beta [Rhodopseudomonas sp.]NVN86449.1 nitrile hydratase subunit beta [Rhodopseudomonas sp.]
MDGAHDMGGVAGFGPVVPEPNEPWFHAEWERRAFALTLAMARPGGWNIDMSRFARENRPPQDYLSKSYFEIWLAGLERLMAERELVTADEIAAARPLHPRKAVPVLTAADVTPMLRRGAPTARAASHPARFAIGDRVRTKDLHPPTHTRLPRYVRGHLGVIELVHGAHVFADSNASGAGEDPQWLYTVVFDGRELWGADGDASATVSVDAWEPYLERA